MNIKTEQKNGRMLVTVDGRMDAVTAPEFETTCLGLADQGSLHIAADLSALEYISSAGLRSILASAKKLKKIKGDLCFCGLSGMVEDVFRVSGFHAMFTIADTVEDLPGV